MGTDEVKPTDPQRDEPPSEDYLDEQETESFPSSDPHSDWAGPSDEPGGWQQDRRGSDHHEGQAHCAQLTKSRFRKLPGTGLRRRPRISVLPCCPPPRQFGGQTRPTGPRRPCRRSAKPRLTCPNLAERVGFEPTVSFPTHDFQSCRFGRSRTPPASRHASLKRPRTLGAGQ